MFTFKDDDAKRRFEKEILEMEDEVQPVHVWGFPVDALSFGQALEALQSGYRVARKGWNGKNMFLVYVPGSEGLTVDEGRPLAKAGLPVGTKFNYLPHVDMWTAQGDLVPWLCSQSDMLARDWSVIG